MLKQPPFPSSPSDCSSILWISVPVCPGFCVLTWDSQTLSIASSRNRSIILYLKIGICEPSRKIKCFAKNYLSKCKAYIILGMTIYNDEFSCRIYNIALDEAPS